LAIAVQLHPVYPASRKLTILDAENGPQQKLTAREGQGVFGSSEYHFLRACLNNFDPRWKRPDSIGKLDIHADG
jgi:hypothetical protein